MVAHETVNQKRVYCFLLPAVSHISLENKIFPQKYIE